MIHVGHIASVQSRFSIRRISLIHWRSSMGAMSQEHRVINQERVILVALYVINQEVVDRVRAVGNLAAFTVGDY